MKRHTGEAASAEGEVVITLSGVVAFYLEKHPRDRLLGAWEVSQPGLVFKKAIGGLTFSKQGDSGKHSFCRVNWQLTALCCASVLLLTWCQTFLVSPLACQ